MYFPKSRKRTFREQNGICYYCGESIIYKEWTVDHKIPRSRGGLGKDVNGVGACYTCNHAKGNMTETEFLETNYLSNERRQALGYPLPPEVSYNKAKRQHNQRIDNTFSYSDREVCLNKIEIDLFLSNS